VDIPEFTGLGTRVSELISSAIAGRTSVSSALAAAQKDAQQTAIRGGYKKK
jgi:sorbitol/mannitol transport system substrate-binding protein